MNGYIVDLTDFRFRVPDAQCVIGSPTKRAVVNDDVMARQVSAQVGTVADEQGVDVVQSLLVPRPESHIPDNHIMTENDHRIILDSHSSSRGRLTSDGQIGPRDADRFCQFDGSSHIKYHNPWTGLP